MKAYADQIAAAPEDEAAFFSADADKLIDADTYLTPTEKQKAKENFAKLSVNGMVNNNPEVAKKALSDPGRFPNLTDIERREYLQKADNLLLAKEKDRLAAEEREKKLKKSAADLNITRAKYLFVSGEMSAEEALKVADDNYMDSPETALTLRERVLGKPGGEKSDPNVLKELEEKIKNKTATKEEIVFANIDKTLNDEDYKELLAQGSAITQFGDLGSAVYKAGFWNTMFENVKAWQGKSEITLEDLGLNKVITDGGYVDTSKLTKHLDKVLKYTGFEKIDGISKMTLVNAAVNKARRDAQAGSKELEEYLRVEFGNRWKEVANDLKEGRKTPEIIEYAMFQLMDVQPVTIDQMPKFYAEGGKKRMFYMMKSYFIKQLNEYRKICFETAKTNPQKALVDLMRLTLWLMLFNAGADFLKDLLFGREIDVTDTLLENVFVGGSINRYTGMSIKRDGLFKTIQDQLAFPVIFDEIIKDVLSNRDVADYKSWRNVPLIGNPYYYWFGGGSK